MCPDIVALRPNFRTLRCETSTRITDRMYRMSNGYMRLHERGRERESILCHIIDLFETKQVSVRLEAPSPCVMEIMRRFL